VFPALGQKGNVSDHSPTSFSGARPEFARSFDPWRETPRKSIVILLVSVFLFFTTVGFTNDIMVLGRTPSLRFVLAVLISGGCAIVYAIAAISLRAKSWKIILPLLALQIAVMSLLTNLLPNLPQPIPLNAAAVGRVETRMILDSIAILAAVSLGYAGFFHVSVKEALRYVQTRTEKAELESEMAAARQVQQVILPGSHQSIPGYVVDSIYKPAREVGGDFFQVLPVDDTGLLFVIGDVSGKGLPAAMLVSMVVGAIRAVAEETHDPVVLLRKLNSGLAGRTSDGFVTALAAFFANDGRVTLANAGHLSPYLDGQDFELPGALPLGINGGGHHPAITLELPAGSRLTFLSDGVVEAQNASGELFGFDRAKLISTQSAAAIVDAAVQFGQADDITAVTIERRATS